MTKKRENHSDINDNEQPPKAEEMPQVESQEKKEKERTKIKYFRVCVVDPEGRVIDKTETISYRRAQEDCHSLKEKYTEFQVVVLGGSGSVYMVL